MDIFKEIIAADDGEKSRETAGLYRAIIDNVVDGIITIDETGRILSFNRAAEKIFGYKAEEVIGKNVNALMPEPYHSNHPQYLRNYLETGVKKIIGIGREVSGLRKNGTVFPMDLAVGEVKLDGRRIFAGIARDITERKEIEQQKADFYAMVTHDIKSPLTVVLGFAEVMSMMELAPDVKEMAEGIDNNAKKIIGLLEDFLDMSRLESARFALEPAKGDLLELVGSIAEQFRPLAEKKRISLSVDADGRMPAVVFDAKYLVRAVSNMVQNAINYTPEGGRVVIAAYLRQAKDGRVAEVSVSDTGIGIPAGDIKRIFEKYYRSPSVSNTKGSGLGLALVKAVAEAHGGNISVHSEEGKGSTFVISLPL
ncbi:MAG TPA: PAS domain-containing sensor histidine kinase [Nitrospirota bacterium]